MERKSVPARRDNPQSDIPHAGWRESERAGEREGESVV